MCLPSAGSCDSSITYIDGVKGVLLYRGVCHHLGAIKVTYAHACLQPQYSFMVLSL